MIKVPEIFYKVRWVYLTQTVAALLLCYAKIAMLTFDCSYVQQTPLQYALHYVEKETLLYNLLNKITN